jgi:hypothetical protein
MVVATVVGGLVVASGGLAHAAKSVEKFCEQAQAISQIVPDLSTEDGFADAAEQFAKAYKKLAKAAPEKDVRKAAKTVSKYYLRLAESGDPNSQDANYQDNEVEAVSTVTTYAAETCAGFGS